MWIQCTDTLRATLGTRRIARLTYRTSTFSLHFSFLSSSRVSAKIGYAPSTTSVRYQSTNALPSSLHIHSFLPPLSFSHVFRLSDTNDKAWPQRGSCTLSLTIYLCDTLPLPHSPTPIAERAVMAKTSTAGKCTRGGDLTQGRVARSGKHGRDLVSPALDDGVVYVCRMFALVVPDPITLALRRMDNILAAWEKITNRPWENCSRPNRRWLYM
jgi:hypothetical protein